MNNEFYMVIAAVFGFALARIITRLPLNTDIPVSRKLKELYTRKAGPK